MRKRFVRGIQIVMAVLLAGGCAGYIDGEHFLRGGGASSLPQAQADELAYAQPGPNDFEFSGGAIKKLKSSYVSSLTEAQKQDVRLVIPDEINGQKVTAIADMAFYSYTQPSCTYTQLDLSQTTSLQSIGSNAFRYALKAPGDLVLPDTVTTIGESAFADCGFDGTLHLPENAGFTTIPDQAFLNTKFTGTLVIPANVRVVQRKAFESTSFSGELNIPEGVSELYASAFTDCKGITSVTIPSTLDFKKRDSDSGHHFRNCSSLERVTFAPNSSMTTLYSEDFGGCSSLKVLDLPDSIVSIDGAAFRSSGLQTVYLPAVATISKNASSFLTTANNAVAVCQDKTSYDSYFRQLPSSTQKYLGYPTTVTFDAGSYGPNPSSQERLAAQPLNRVKDAATGIWAADGAYELPNLSNAAGQMTPWYSDAAKSNAVTVATKVTDAMTLYAGAAIVSDPVLSYEDVFKTYDGETSYLRVHASHPLAKDPSEAVEGDYALYYYWRYWNDETRTWSDVGQSFYLDTVEVKDVADTGTYRIRTYLRQLKSGKWDTAIEPYIEDLRAQITPATPTVNPVLSPDASSNLEDFPGLALSDGDTPGTLTWDAGQTLVDGTNSYAWTFTPTPPAEGKPANYKSATGTIDLRVANGDVVQRVSFDTAGGTSIEDADVPFGSSLSGVGVPTKEGYLFAGWYRDAELTRPFTLADKVSEDMTLHARWEKRIATVNPGKEDLEVNGQRVDPTADVIEVIHSPEVVVENQQALQTSSELAGKGEPAGFFELNLVVNGEIVEQAEFKRSLRVTVAFPVEERTVYAVGHLRHDGTVEMLDAHADLAAQTLSFEVDTLSPFMVVAQKLCDVTFDSGGGSAVAPVRDVAAGSRIVAPVAPTREGYTFVGWSKDAAGTQPWDFDRDVVEGDLTLYARWKAVETPGTDDPAPDNPTPPDNPVVPDDPDDPDDPTDPEKPDNQGDPERPSDPDDPENPDGQKGPDGAENPDGADGSTTPPATGDDGDGAGGSDGSGQGSGTGSGLSAKPLPSVVPMPKSGDAPVAFLLATLVLVAALSGSIALRTRRRRS